MQALQLMVDTYTKTPEFGDATQFQQELDIVKLKVKNVEEDLTVLNRDLDLVESKMNLSMRHSLLSSPSRSLLSFNTSSCSGESISSDLAGLGSQGESCDSDKEESIEKNIDKDVINKENSTEILNILEQTSENISVVESEISEDVSEDIQISFDWVDEFEDEYPEQKVIALYAYDGAEEGTLSMNVGDEFDIVGADVDGWIFVKKTGFIEQGFIPTAYTQPL